MENENTIATQAGPLTSTAAIAALAALAQESRLAVFRLLVQTGPDGMAATKIAEALAIAPSSLSFHLKELAHANLVTASKAGRSIIYAANYAGMNGLLAFLTENCCAGSPCCVSAPHLPKDSTT
ncbi:transcriptional regulator, ArsR family [Janthinobacterium sp. TND4EL3]|uniref:ArsR/SmtB family transcription factor n=1 Tax=Janthinobacterium sp. TND4EL3 TaxID=1907311 RepID=UPI000955C9DD|nr:metalloregulator ArsR/SmtB family transcription factor [Janthinobacterium sp. TND4EL3]SIR25662.1 transcriptional regulator, ArsR family [Janthinobacterium sp. TND4EL3]